eukprot:1363213-Amorphochlora_amoeboformis.AAC.1
MSRYRWTITGKHAHVYSQHRSRSRRLPETASSLLIVSNRYHPIVTGFQTTTVPRRDIKPCHALEPPCEASRIFRPHVLHCPNKQNQAV